MQHQAAVSDKLSVKFDPTNPHVGIPSGHLVVAGQSGTPMTIPFQLVGDGVESPDAIRDAVNAFLTTHGWNISVSEVKVGF